MMQLSLGVIMTKPFIPFLVICLMAATAAQAQSAGGHGRGGRGGQSPSGGGGSTPATGTASTPRSKPANEVEIIGVVKAIDPDSGRITIAYEAVEALNWPAGTMPFAVSTTALLKSATLGEKVRFKLDSQQISDLKPF
jgi:Cu/Ag efflux protein CusF